ncbi:hypothetical protein D3C85_1740510 [compost metagenome]
MSQSRVTRKVMTKARPKKVGSLVRKVINLKTAMSRVIQASQVKAAQARKLVSKVSLNRAARVANLLQKTVQAI